MAVIDNILVLLIPQRAIDGGAGLRMRHETQCIPNAFGF